MGKASIQKKYQDPLKAKLTWVCRAQPLPRTEKIPKWVHALTTVHGNPCWVSLPFGITKLYRRMCSPDLCPGWILKLSMASVLQLLNSVLLDPSVFGIRSREQQLWLPQAYPGTKSYNEHNALHQKVHCHHMWRTLHKEGICCISMQLCKFVSDTAIARTMQGKIDVFPPLHWKC